MAGQSQRSSPGHPLLGVRRRGKPMAGVAKQFRSRLTLVRLELS
jgi:hypothetical protein